MAEMACGSRVLVRSDVLVRSVLQYIFQSFRRGAVDIVIMSRLKPLKPLKPTTDPTYDLLRSENLPLSSFFRPQCIAVVGATDRQGSVGKTVLWNLLSHPFGGTVFPINPKRKSVLGVRAYPTVAEAPDRVDLALVITPAPTVPGIVKQCVEANVESVIVLSAGFKEIGERGIQLEREILDTIKGTATRVIGPNCLGLMHPLTGLNATFASSVAKPGNVGFISQSGALCTAVLDWSLQENVGFSAFVSIGSMLDVNWGDLIEYLGDDPRTHSIVIYMETVGNARRFLSAAREVALTKPIIVIKAGRTAEAAKAAASHTGSLAGSDAVLDAAFTRCGVLRVDSIAQLFNLAEVLSKQVSQFCLEISRKKACLGPEASQGTEIDDHYECWWSRSVGHRSIGFRRRQIGHTVSRDTDCFERCLASSVESWQSH